jgi:methylated-DNA-protein-cysteine methyltransferase-like protein
VKHRKRAQAPAAALTPFLAAVRKAVRAIPRGQTRSYGTIAEIVGKPGAARAVVRALHALGDLPWWRVCRAGGKFAPQVAVEQESLLRQEGWRPVRKAKKGPPGEAGSAALTGPTLSRSDSRGRTAVRASRSAG